MEKYKWLHQIGYIKLHINGYIQMVTNKRQQKVLVVARVYWLQHRCRLKRKYASSLNDKLQFTITINKHRGC